MRISMRISAWYLKITMIVNMTIQNPTISLCSNYLGMQSQSGHQVIPSHQHLENELWQLHHLVSRHNPYIRAAGRCILPLRTRMNASLRHWHPRRYQIKHLNHWIGPLMSIFSGGMNQKKPVSNWSHGKLEICGNMSNLLTMWHASLSVQNTMRRQLIQPFRRWSWNVWSLLLSHMQCL